MILSTVFENSNHISLKLLDIYLYFIQIDNKISQKLSFMAPDCLHGVCHAETRTKFQPHFDSNIAALTGKGKHTEIIHFLSILNCIISLKNIIDFVI